MLTLGGDGLGRTVLLPVGIILANHMHHEEVHLNATSFRVALHGNTPGGLVDVILLHDPACGPALIETKRDIAGIIGIHGRAHILLLPSLLVIALMCLELAGAAYKESIGDMCGAVIIGVVLPCFTLSVVMIGVACLGITNVLEWKVPLDTGHNIPVWMLSMLLGWAMTSAVLLHIVVVLPQYVVQSACAQLSLQPERIRPKISALVLLACVSLALALHSFLGILLSVVWLFVATLSKSTTKTLFQAQGRTLVILLVIMGASSASFISWTRLPSTLLLQLGPFEPIALVGSVCAGVFSSNATFGTHAYSSVYRGAVVLLIGVALATGITNFFVCLELLALKLVLELLDRVRGLKHLGAFW